MFRFQWNWIKKKQWYICGIRIFAVKRHLQQLQINNPLEEYWHFLYQEMCLETMMKCHMFFMWLSNFLLRIGVIPFKFSYAVLLQYRMESPIEFPSCIVYQLSDVSDRFPKISIGGLKWIFPLQQLQITNHNCNWKVWHLRMTVNLLVHNSRWEAKKCVHI